ncbi:MAG: FixH family protein [Brumimicrobium sp.]|nr:FixH family protein [Brumimicrobium sp.]
MKFFKNTGNLLILGFVLAALGMIYMAYVATTVKYEMAVEGDYYQEETKFNNVLEAKKNASYFGDDFRIEEKDSKVIIIIPALISESIEEGSVQFYCVSDKSKDSRRKLSQNDTGIYQFNRQEVASGHNYLVRVSFKSFNKEYYKEFQMQ